MFCTDITIDVLLFFYVIVSLFMCLVVMMQRSKQEGLGAAFGGGFTESVWGAQTSQVLVKTTVILAVLFFLLSIALARLYSHREELAASRASTLKQELMAPVPAIVTNAAPLTPSAPVPATPTASTAASPAPATPARNAAPAASAQPAAK